jgi:hypothetical protein
VVSKPELLESIREKVRQAVDLADHPEGRTVQSRLQAAALSLALIPHTDLPDALLPDFVSIEQRMRALGPRDYAMTDEEAEEIFSDVRNLYVEILRLAAQPVEAADAPVQSN